MNLLDKLNGRYTLDCDQSREKIVNILQDRIDTANKNTSWFSFPAIDYRNIKVDSFRMIIRRTNQITLDQIPGTGNIVVHFNDTATGQTQINAEVRPLKSRLLVTTGCLIPVTTVIGYLSRTAEAVLILIAVWIFVVGINYGLVVISRYKLKRYLELILADIGINEPLKKEDY